MGSASSERTMKEKLIRNVKKEVKSIMEEGVTKKFVHEESGSITSLCAAVEACVSHGLKRRALGLFKSSSTAALLHKVAKSFQPAATIVQLVAEVENCDRSSSGSENSAIKLVAGLSSGSIVKPPLQKKNSNPHNTASMKYLWIRLALIEKELAKIVDYIVQNSSKYYEKDALVSDPDYGSILSSLLVGPCALDFSKLRTNEYYWRDPPADELVQRHRISSGQFPVTPASPPVHNRRPGLHYKGSIGFSNSDDNMRSKDYVESLHQNNKSTLLYGKNNVLVFIKDGTQPLAGYMSLHQYGDVLNLKWTPNQLMNGCADPNTPDKGIYWEYALNVLVHETVYVHCHQGLESDWIVLVGQDGVQRPPIHFPRGGHLLAFLSCLENGLLPHGMLDPPLWSQRGKGKVFPKLRRKGSSRFHSEQIKGDEMMLTTTMTISLNNGNDGDINEAGGITIDTSDFVFRIVYPHFLRTLQSDETLEFPGWTSSPSTPRSAVPPVTPRSTPLHSVSTTSSTSSSRSLDQQASLQIQTQEQGQQGESIHIVCQSMKKQIISRAFYGWLAHCRHLRTVRTHLVGLVHPEAIKHDIPEDATGGLTEEKWQQMQEAGNISMQEIYRLVYFGGMAHPLRRKLWPILLSGTIEGEDEATLRRDYEDRMSEWLAIEAIVRQKDKETMAMNLAKLSSEGTISEVHPPLKHLQTHESNEVFEEVEPTTSSAKKSKEDAVIEEQEQEESSGGGGEQSNAIDSSSDISSSDDASPTKTKGGVISPELLESFGLNIHRIDKDVKRCDRNYWYFTEANLDKLRNVMCTYVWENMEMGYVQGMCDLAAPLLVILDDEALAYGCFRKLMERMSCNFPSGGGAMDSHFANMRSLLQILDHDLFSLIRQNGDYTHFYFCYRWFLLDFKREFCYDDVFLMWETIWAARQVASSDFVLFVALGLLTYYRGIILANSMDFTDIIKFFNEMAERHDAKLILQIARSLVLQLQTLIENK